MKSVRGDFTGTEARGNFVFQRTVKERQENRQENDGGFGVEVARWRGVFFRRSR